MRFTLSRVFISVAIVGLACAGMVHRTDLWAAGIVTLTFLLFTAVAIHAASLRQGARTAAITFAAAGTLYLIIVMCAREIGQGALITNYPLAFAARQMNIETPSQPVFSPNGLQMPGTLQREESLGTIIFQANEVEATGGLGHFFLIGHCVWAWLFATTAGTIAGYMHAKGNAN